MRISTGMIFDAGVSSINKQTSALLHLQQQVASGRRMLTPSDDPVAAARALEVTQSRDIVAQFKVNHNNASSALGLEEAQLSSTSDLLARVRELAVQGGNTSLSNSDRRAITTELRARFEELTGIANATDGGGQYLFSGFMGSVKPFGGSVESIIGGGEVGYAGDEGQRKLQVSPTRFLEISDSGMDVFKRVRSGNGYFVTGYAAANTGTAIIDAGNVTDPIKWNAVANKDFSIQFTVDSSVSPAVTYYDIVDNVGFSLLTGNPVNNSYPPDTTGLRVYRSGEPIELRDLINFPPNFDYGASVTISGDPVMSQVPPPPAAPTTVVRDSFSVGPSSSQSIFATIAKLIGAMETVSAGTSGGPAKLASDIGFALTNLDQASDNILRVRAQIGSRMAEIESLTGLNEDLDLQYQQTLSQLQDLDYAKAISDLTRKQTDLQAAQQSFVRVSQLSLFNYL